MRILYGMSPGAASLRFSLVSSNIQMEYIYRLLEARRNFFAHYIVYRVAGLTLTVIDLKSGIIPEHPEYIAGQQNAQ